MDVLWAAAEPGGLEQIELEWDRRTAMGVVLAAHGYPVSPRKGDTISGLPADSENVMVFHAGTAVQDSAVQTTGGRVLCVTALAENVRAARQVAYEAIAQIQFDGMQFRKDIGHRAVEA